MLRGEIWSYIPQGTPRRPHVVLLSSDGINQSARPWLLGAPIGVDDPQDILAVPVQGHGWVSAGHLSRYYRGWLHEKVGAVDAVASERLDAALRAALDL